MTRPLRLLLVAPGYDFAPDGNFGDTHLVALASYAAAHTAVHVDLCDLYYERLLPQPAPERVFDPAYDVVGLSCYSSYDYLKTFYLGVEIRRRRPDVCLIVGGYHPSARPDDFTGPASPFDHVVVGEGERPLARILEACAAGTRLPARVLGPDPVPELDSLPPLDWRYLDRYRPIAGAAGHQFVMHLSRGCPFRCAFCMEGAKGTSGWRAYTPARAEAELRALAAHFDLRGWTLFLTDPLFGLRREWRRDMLARIARLKLPVRKIWALSRADVLDLDDLEAFANANLSLGFGLESGDPDLLAIIHKGGSPDGYLRRFRELAAAAGKLGLAWGANIIVGHPGETPESLVRSAAYVSRLFRRTRPLTGFLSVDPYRFYPGSPIDHALADYGARHGTRVYRPRWWNESDLAFTSAWVDPSRALDFRRCRRMAARLLLPVLHAVERRFAYQGPARDYFLRTVRRQVQTLGVTQQLTVLRDHALWLRLAGHDPSADPRRDPEVRALCRRERGKIVATMAQARGGFPKAIRQALIREPRERYVAPTWLGASVADRALPLIDGRPASLSALHAYATNAQELALRPGDRLVELGCGTGYGAAIFAQLVGPTGHVLSYEIDPELAALARRNLAGRPNVTVVAGTLQPDEAPPACDKLLVAYAIAEVPAAWLAALPVGGRLVAPVVQADRKQQLRRYVRTTSGIEATDCGPVAYVPDRRTAFPGPPAA